MFGIILRKLFHFLLGAILLVIFSIFQKIAAGFPLKINAFVVPFLFGGSSGFVVGLLFDRIKYKNKELQIAHDKAEESNRLKDIFINNLSHEIRTPMNSILGFSNLLVDVNCNSENKEYVKNINLSSKQLLKIVDNLLEISALKTLDIPVNKTTFDLYLFLKYLKQDLKNLLNNKNLLFNYDLSEIENPTNIITDKEKLLKIIYNLVENSIKFTHQGRVDVSFSINKEYLIFKVKDTGIGIDQKYLKSIFEPFVQETADISINYGGLGVGLSIADLYIKLLNGDLEINSEKNKGTTVRVSLPIK